MPFYDFRPYVSAAERQRSAKQQLAKLAKRGLVPQPIQIEGRTIARSFWGKAWCENLESYMDYANRLPRGRTYVRNGSVIHLEIKPGAIEAMVSGSDLYKVKITIAPVRKTQWEALCSECSGGIGSLVELLQGRLSDRVMGVITRKQTGLFPAPTEIEMSCSCPDSASMCKHIAAVCYGVGARLDSIPDLLFRLRSVNHEELITQAAAASELAAKAAGQSELSDDEMSAVFGIELDTTSAGAAPNLPMIIHPNLEVASSSGDLAKPNSKPTARRKNAKSGTPRGKKRPSK